MADSPQRPTALAGTRRLAGFHTLPAWDPYEDYVGPMYERVSDDGVRCAMEIEARHCNTAGIAHGGLLMTFADYASFVIAREAIGGPGGATVSMTSDFTAPVGIGDLLESDGEIMRETRSMVFMRGRHFVADNTVFSYSAIIKKSRHPKS